MSLIIENLFLGNVLASETLGATASLVVNCTEDLPFFGNTDKQKKIRISVKDNGDDSQHDKLLRYLLDDRIALIETIDSEISKGNKVLVHCRAGQQRSAAVVAAYLMEKHGLSTIQAINFIRSKKRDAFFGSVNFQRTLDEFQNYLKRSYSSQKN